MVEPDRPQMTVRCIHFPCWITKATETHRIFNTYHFSVATMVKQTCLNVTFIWTLPLLYR
jgi:hypothetical protein